MAEDNKKALETIQRLRMGIGKESDTKKVLPKNTMPKPTEGLKIPTLDDIGAPTMSVTELFELINRHGAQHSSGGIKADFTQEETAQPTAKQTESTLKSISDELVAKMSPQQQENWRKLGDFIDNWMTEKHAK